MTDILKDFNSGVVEAMAKRVQAEVEEMKPLAHSTQAAEKAVAPSARIMMAPVVNKALQNGVEGSDILEAIHRGTEAAKKNK